MVGIEAQLILYVDVDEEAGRDADGQTEDVERGEELVALEGAPGDEEVVLPHGQDQWITCVDTSARSTLPSNRLMVR